MEQKGNEQSRDVLLKMLKDTQEQIKKIKEKHGEKYETLDSIPKRHERRTVWTESFPLDHKKLKSLVECLIESGYRIREIRTTVTEGPIGGEVRSFIHESIDCYIAHAKDYIRSFDDIIIDDKKYTTVIGLVNYNAVGIMMDTDESTLNVMIRSENDSLPKIEDVEKAKNLIGHCLHIVDENSGFDTFDDISPIAPVYAAPERMSNSPKEFSTGLTYPILHAVPEGAADYPEMNAVYGSPQVMSENHYEKSVKQNEDVNKIAFCGNCGKGVDRIDAFCRSCGAEIRSVNYGVTLLFCPKCGGDNYCSNRYCVFCGYEMKILRPQPEYETPIAPVYASPDVMSIRQTSTSPFTPQDNDKRYDSPPMGEICGGPSINLKWDSVEAPKKKEGFFKRLLRRKNK